MKRSAILLVFVVCGVIYCSKETIPVKNNTEDAAICQINGIEFKVSEFFKFIDDHKIPESVIMSHKNEILANFLDLFIEQKIIELKIKKEQIAIDSQELEAIIQNNSDDSSSSEDNGYQERIRKDILLQKYLLLKLIPKLDITEDEVRDYYKKHRDGFIMNERIKIMQIMLQSKEDADALYAKLIKSPKLMKQLIEKRAIDEIQTKGIILATYQKGELPKEIEEHLWKLPIGIIDKPFTSESGDSMIFEAVERYPQGLAPLEEVQDKIEKKLALLRFDQMNEQLKNELRLASTIVIYKNNINFIYSGKFLNQMQ